MTVGLKTPLGEILLQNLTAQLLLDITVLSDRNLQFRHSGTIVPIKEPLLIGSLYQSKHLF